MRYMIYELRNPITDLPFYIGWTDTKEKGKHRPTEHLLEEARIEGNITKGNRSKLNTIRKIKQSGHEVEVRELFWSDDFEYSLSIEVYFIAQYGRKDLKTGCLTNLTDGGEGTLGRKDSDETRKKKANGRTGVKASDRTRALISAANLGKSSYIRDDEFRKKLSERSWFRIHANESFDERYGPEKAAEVREKQSESRKRYLKEHPEAETARKIGHAATWIKKMAPTYLSIFAMLDEGKRQFEIIAALNTSPDTVRKANNEKEKIMWMIDQYANQ